MATDGDDEDRPIDVEADDDDDDDDDESVRLMMAASKPKSRPSTSKPADDDEPINDEPADDIDEPSVRRKKPRLAITVDDESKSTTTTTAKKPKPKKKKPKPKKPADEPTDPSLLSDIADASKNDWMLAAHTIVRRATGRLFEPTVPTDTKTTTTTTVPSDAKTTTTTTTTTTTVPAGFDDAGWSWLKTVGPSLTDAVKIGLLHTAARQYALIKATAIRPDGSRLPICSAAGTAVFVCRCGRCSELASKTKTWPVDVPITDHLFSILTAIGWPVSLRGTNWMAGIVETFADYCRYEKLFYDLIRKAAADPVVRKLQSRSHVLVRIVANVLWTDSYDFRKTVATTVHKTRFILNNCAMTADDISDLRALGWSPTIVQVIDRLSSPNMPKTAASAGKPNINAMIELLLPSFWTDATKTMPDAADDDDDELILTATDPAPLFEPAEFTDPLRQPDKFWNEPLSDRLSTAFTSAVRAGATQLQRQRSDDDDGDADNGTELTPANWQRLLSILHKSAVWSQYSFSRHRMRWIDYLTFFDDSHTGPALQLLMRPSTTTAACRCLQERLYDNHRRRKTERARIRSLTAAGMVDAAARFRRARFDTGNRCHSAACLDGQAIHAGTKAVQPLCRFWLRPDSTTAVKSDCTWTSKYYGQKLAEPNGIGKIGRAVAATHLFAILYWRGVSTTTALIAGDILLAWPNRPSEKLLRTFFAAISKLPVRPVGLSSVPTTSTTGLLLSKDPETAPLSTYLRQLHNDLLAGSTVRHMAADLQALSEAYRLAASFMRDVVVV